MGAALSRTSVVGMQDERTEAEEGEEAVDVGHGGRLELSRPERTRLQDESGEDGGRQQRVGHQAAGAREDPERRVALHASPPASSVASGVA